MPELPEVEHFRRVAQFVCQGPIDWVEVTPDDLIFESPADAIEDALSGARVLAVRRHGKQLALELEDGQRLVLRFGMTGALRSPQRAPLELEGAKPDLESWPPKFTKMRLRCGDREFALTCTRRIARVRLERTSQHPFPPADLGFDALTGDVVAGLPCALARKKGAIKGALLDQRVCAGLGNWLVDEVLREARIHPASPVPSLGVETMARLAEAIGEVLALATAVDARSESFPRRWLFHVRWGVKPATHTLEGQAIEYGRVAGRRTLWVPEELD